MAAASVACAVNAQEVWTASSYDLSNATLETLTNNIYSGGTAEAPDYSMPGELKSSQILVSTDNITLTGVSTPNADKTIETGAAAWDMKGGAESNVALNTDLCDPKFDSYLMGQGNPEEISWYYYEETDNGTAFRVAGVYWEPGKDMPAKGLYWKFDTKAAGTLKVGIYCNKVTTPTYVVDADTKQPLPYGDIEVAIYYQNNTFVYEGSVDDGDAKYINEGTMPENYVVQQVNGCTQNRPALGYLTFAVEANKTYYLFNPKSQVGLYGYEFTPGTSGDTPSEPTESGLTYLPVVANTETVGEGDEATTSVLNFEAGAVIYDNDALKGTLLYASKAGASNYTYYFDADGNEATPVFNYWFQLRVDADPTGGDLTSATEKSDCSPLLLEIKENLASLYAFVRTGTTKSILLFDSSCAQVESTVVAVTDPGSSDNSFFTVCWNNVAPGTYLISERGGTGRFSGLAYETGTSALETIAVDENAPVEYYNLQGVRVANPDHGLYIKRQGNKVTKVIL